MKKEKEKNGQGKAYQLNQILPPVNDSVSKLHFHTQGAPASSFMIVKNKISVISNTPVMMEPLTPKRNLLALILTSDISLCLSHIEIYKAKYTPILKQIFPTRCVLFPISVYLLSWKFSVIHPIIKHVHITSLTHLISAILKKRHVSLLPNPGLISYCWRDHC